MSLNKFNKRMRKALVKEVSLHFAKVTCSAGCHNLGIALFDGDTRVTEPSLDPVVALERASQHMLNGVAMFKAWREVELSEVDDGSTEKPDVKQAEQSSDKPLPDEEELDALLAELGNIFGPMRSKVKIRIFGLDRGEQAKAEPAKTEPNQSAS